jgi:menaquinone-specific isochorismate synthase
VTDPGLHARTVALDYGPDALQFDGSPTVLFDRPGLTLVGWGTALLVEADEAAAVLAAIPCDDAVRRPGSGVVALGALPFLATRQGLLIVPRFTMGIAQEPDGTVHRWATAVGPTDLALPATDELFDAVIWQYGSRPEADPAAGADRDVAITALTTTLSNPDYQRAVARAVATLRAPEATLDKVVLSRSVTAQLDGPLPLSAVLRRLRAHEPACTIFSFPVPDGTFFGASPELLMARHGRHVTCHPLAGTVARGQTARADADAQGGLAGSAKDRSEHRFVVDSISAALRPLCDELTVPSEPSLVAFRSVAHLGTRIEGHLRDADPPLGILDLVELVHPTPAVGGTPRTEALATIATLEADARGYWAGPVGWADAKGDGEWMIGIRSARLHSDGRTVTLRAGAGVVADSDPAAEAAETDVKLTSVLESLVPGGSAHLC